MSSANSDFSWVRSSKMYEARADVTSMITPNDQTGWDELLQWLQGLQATGETGFEGLMAVMLSQFTGHRFVVASSGTQASGDARDTIGAATIQAKRYSSSPAPTTSEIEIEVIRASNTLPRLDVYVLAITRDAAQLHDGLNRISYAHGIDIVVLDESGPGPTTLSSLCIAYWNLIAHFTSTHALPDSFGVFVNSQLHTEPVLARLEQLKNELNHSLRSFANLADRARSRLMDTLTRPESLHPLSMGQVIDFDAWYPRPLLSVELNSWLTREYAPVLLLEGEEGMGKTWCAARLAVDAAESGILTFWLNHSEWADLQTVEDIFKVCLRAVGIREQEVVSRYSRKLTTRWSSTTLFVLDDAHRVRDLGSTESLVDDAQALNSRPIKLLMPTRPLHRRLELSKTPWDRCVRAEVLPLTDSELADALKTFETSISINDIPANLNRLVRIPRYLRISLRLKDRLKSLSRVTPHVLHFTNLCDKLDQFDPQVRSTLGFATRDDAKQILAHLAQGVELAPAQGIPHVPNELLRRCFQHDPDVVKRTLVELRLADDVTWQRAALNPDVVLLGWALFVLVQLKTQSGTDHAAYADEIRRSLGPIPTDDLRVEALNVAAIISLIDSGSLGPNPHDKRAALIYTWVTAPNTRVTSEPLDFWAETDPVAYATFIQNHIEEIYNDHALDYFASSLARAWRDNLEVSKDIAPFLHRWLLLVWRDDIPPANTTFAYQGSELPVALTRFHLVLSQVALAILSVRPDLQMLNSLALCAGTIEASILHHNDRDFRIKGVDTQLGNLLRWEYGESIVNHLQSIAETPGAIQAVTEGAKRLAASLRHESLPAHLKMPERPIQFAPPTDALSLLKERKRLFASDRSPRFWLLSQLEPLAAWADSPALSTQDAEWIVARVRELVQGARILSHRMATSDDLDFRPLWPWLARLDPTGFAEMVGKLQIRAVEIQDPYPILSFLSGSLNSGDSALNARLSSEILRWFRERSKSTGTDIPAIAMAELFMFVGSEDDFTEWLELLSQTEATRTTIAILPSPWILQRLAPSNLATYSSKRAVECLHSARSERAQEKRSELTFWLQVTANSASVNQELHNWVTKLLIDQTLTEEERRMAWGVFAATAEETWLQNLLDAPEANPTLDAIALDALEWFPSRWPKSLNTDHPYETILRIIPHDLAAWVFVKSERLDDLDRWGQDLIAVFSFVKSSLSTRPRQLATSGQSNIQPLSPWWNTYDFDHFGAHAEFRTWALRNPTAFMDFITPVLDSPQHVFGLTLGLSKVIDSALCVLLEVAPSAADAALRTYRQAHFKITNTVGVPTLIAALWDRAKTGNETILRICKGLLLDARSDLEILTLSVAALSTGSGHIIRQFVLEGLLTSSFAKDRALAASVLPWFAEDWAQETLQGLMSKDPSLWVREHATWASRAALLEVSCRVVYRQAINEPDLVKASALLQIIKPALSPTSSWWHRAILAEEPARPFHTPRFEAAHVAFWAHEDSSRSSRDRVCKRELKDYCRGEKLERTAGIKVIPHWELD